MTDANEEREIHELTKQECLELLARNEIGRLAVVADGQPRIFPVNYVLDGEIVVFRTDPGTKLDHAGLDRVAFEVDEIDRHSRTATSVAIAGIARELTDALDRASEREQAMDLRPWASGTKDHWVRILPIDIAGRRIDRLVSTDSGPSTP